VIEDEGRKGKERKQNWEGREMRGKEMRGKEMRGKEIKVRGGGSTGRLIFHLTSSYQTTSHYVRR
jgi:hypothetical protein